MYVVLLMTRIHYFRYISFMVILGNLYREIIIFVIKMITIEKCQLDFAVAI